MLFFISDLQGRAFLGPMRVRWQLFWSL